MSDERSAAAGWEAPAQRRPRWPAALAVAALVVVAAVVLQRGGDEPDSGIVVEERRTPTAPEPVRSPSPSPAASPAPTADTSPSSPGGAARHPDWWPRTNTSGTWVSLPSAGIAGRAAPVVAWTGAAAQHAAGARPAAYEPFVRGLVLVWGGYDGDGGLDDGAAYDPFTGLWRRLPAAPAAWTPRAVEAGAWSGEELLTVGASADGGAERWMAFDPAADRWRELPSPPPEVADWQAAGWTGSELVVLSAGGDREAAGALRAAGYDPDADAWRGLPAPPLDADRGALRTVTLPEGLAVFGMAGDRPAVAVLSADGRAWTAPEPMPEVPGVVLPLLSAATADQPMGRLLVVGTSIDRADRRHVWSWEADGGWRQLPDLEAPAFGDLGSVAWAGGQLLAWLGDGRFAGAVLPANGERWQPMAPPPLSRRRDAGAVWTGQSLVVWGGWRGTALLDDGALFVPE